MINIILGTGFGDEGKGQAVHSLSHPEALVVRFSGGHQCGHTAISADGKKHIFSQFGAGTFQGAATYISQHCTVFPIAFLNEYKVLESLIIERKPYYVHPMTMVTTPYDLAFNRALSMITGHGTCGVGFGTTLQRNEDFFNLYTNDLKTPYVFETKMSFIKRYYEHRVKTLNMSSQITYESELETAMESWEESLEFYRNFVTIVPIDEIAAKYKDFVFEGSQGILLDQHFGFFPHVTRSNTSSQNAMEIIKDSVLKNEVINTYYISRCYQTRHGNGPFPDNKEIELINTITESNQENDWQGIFRTAPFDASLVEHAINCDRIYNPDSNKFLIFTCLDQLKDKDAFLKELGDSNLLQIVNGVEMKDRPDWV